MNKILEKIHNYLKETNPGLEPETLDQHSVYLAMEIMEYAHRNQKRVNGEEYANHPMRLLGHYRDLVGIVDGDPFCIDEDLMIKCGVPFSGVQEVCVLHDVVEDSELTFDDVESIFVDCGFKDYFDMYIAMPLKCITHDKSVPYLDYIKICCEHQTSALVKMLDLHDNMNVFSLDEYNDENYKRTANYLNYTYLINRVYNFVENIQNYKKQFQSRQNY